MKRVRLAACLLPLLFAFAGAHPALAADTGPCTQPDQPLRPIAATHTMPPYPELSVMTSEQGTTLLQVHIGADGVPGDVFVVQSSGSPRLDEAALTHVKAYWRWHAPVVGCQPTAMDGRIMVTWDLKDAPNKDQPKPPDVIMSWSDYPPGALARHEHGDVSLMAVVEADGRVTGTRVLRRSGFPDLDDKSETVIASRRWTPAAMDGKPVKTVLFLNLVWKTDNGQ